MNWFPSAAEIAESFYGGLKKSALGRRIVRTVYEVLTLVVIAYVAHRVLALGGSSRWAPNPTPGLVDRYSVVAIALGYILGRVCLGPSMGMKRMESHGLREQEQEASFSIQSVREYFIAIPSLAWGIPLTIIAFLIFGQFRDAHAIHTRYVNLTPLHYHKLVVEGQASWYMHVTEGEHGAHVLVPDRVLPEKETWAVKRAEAFEGIRSDDKRTIARAYWGSLARDNLSEYFDEVQVAGNDEIFRQTSNYLVSLYLLVILFATWSWRVLAPSALAWGASAFS